MYILSIMSQTYHIVVHCTCIDWMDTINCTLWKAHRVDPLSTEDGGTALNLRQDVSERWHLVVLE